MSKVHAQATCRLSMIPAKTSMLAGHFVYNSSNLGDSTPPGANVIQTAFVNNTDVTSLPAQWESNVHIGANGIQLRYNEIILSEWVAKKITKNGVNIDPNFTFYYPKEEQTSGSGGESLLVPAQGLSALKLSAGGMSLYRDGDNNEDENARKLFDLGSSGLIFYSGSTNGINSTPIARFNGNGVQIGKDGVVNAYVTSNSFVLRNENANPVRTFFKVKDGLIGEGSHTDSFIGNGTRVKFDLTYNADSSTYIVKKNNIEVGSTEVNKTTSYFTFIDATPKEGDVITATYNVTRPSISSCTFGIRSSSGIEGDYSVAEGFEVIASGLYSHAEGKRTEANGNVSHAEGNLTKADGADSHSEGHVTQAIGGASHTEGAFTIASGNYSHAGGSHTTASGNYSYAEGSSTIASGEGAHAEGLQTQAINSFSHAEGIFTEAYGYNSHVEGFYSKTIGPHSHAEGVYTTSSHEASHAGGRFTKTSRDGQTVIGEYNKDNSSALFIIGKGGSEDDRSNALEVDSGGKLWIAGNFTTERNISAKNVTATMGLIVSSGGIAVYDNNITLQMDSVNASQANNNVNSTQYPTAFLITDIGKKTLARIEGVIESNGNIGSYWYVRNYNTSGTQVAQKGIKMTMDKSGNLTYTIQDAANFRTALSLGSLATKNSLSASDVGAVPTSRTVNGKALSANISLTASDVGAIAASPSYIEFTGVSSSASHGGYIDFHNGGSSADYTSRIIEDSSAHLKFYADNGVDFTGGASFAGGINSGGYFKSTYTYNNPGGAAASTVQQNTIYISSNGNFIKGNSASSRRYKHNIKELINEDLDPNLLYKIPIIQFVYNTEYLGNKKDCRYLKTLPGFIAEDVYDIYPVAADISDEGSIEGWNEHYIIPPMLALIQEQHKEIELLKQEINQLKQLV